MIGLKALYKVPPNLFTPEHSKVHGTILADTVVLRVNIVLFFLLTIFMLNTKKEDNRSHFQVFGMTRLGFDPQPAAPSP